MTRSNQIGITLFALLTAFLAGCATPARVDQMTVPAVAQPTPQTAFRHSIAIKDVTGGQETNPLWTSQVSSAEFERALEASLQNAALLAPRQAGKYQLSAQLGRLEQPLIGLNMTVTATVLYQLVERTTAKTVWEKTLVTPYTAKFTDSLLAVERLKLANEGAVKENIARLISDLSTAKP